MSKVAIVILTDTEGGDALGRVVNAMTAAKEFKEAGDDVKVLFSGTGTKWIGELAKSEHTLNPVFLELRGNIAGACRFCAEAFEVSETVQSCGIKLSDDYGSNMSYRTLVNEGRQILTF